MKENRRIFINGRFLCSKQATGVQKFALGLLLSLQQTHPEFTIVAPHGNYNLQGLTVLTSGWGCGTLWEQLWLPVFMMLHRRSVLVNLCNTAPLLLKNQIVTIHDLAFLKNRKWFNSAFRRWYIFLIPRICRRSAAVLTVSQVIKKEIAEKFSLPEAKIKVVPNGFPAMDFAGERPYPFRYLFLTGIYNPRKNAAFIISMLPEIILQGYHIVGVGVDARIYLNTGFPDGSNLHLLDYVDDRQYYTLLKHSEALVYPSEYEGFGIPLLEALIMGTPVIAPDIPVYRESFGEQPLYYTAGDNDDFLKVLDKLKFYKPDPEGSLILKNKYNFDASAQILSEIIRSDL